MKRLTLIVLILLPLSYASQCQASDTARANSVLRGKVICIDPGHGGTALSDSFRVGHAGEREEWINLRVGRYLNAMLTSAGATVLMTRLEDVAVPLKDRAMLAVDHKADLFLSIHHNAEADSTLNVPVVYFHGNASENLAGVEFGRCVAASIAKYLFKGDTTVSLVSDRTIFPESGAAVLRNSYGIPGVLAEASFFTNREEELRLKDSSYNRLEAQAFFDAMVEYFSHPRAEIKPYNSLFVIPPYAVYQEAQRMSDSAKSWYAFYLKGKERFNEGTETSLREAFQLFSASAKGFPDSYVAGECHEYLSRLTAATDSTFSRNEKERAHEFYVRGISPH